MWTQPPNASKFQNQMAKTSQQAIGFLNDEKQYYRKRLIEIMNSDNTQKQNIQLSVIPQTYKETEIQQDDNNNVTEADFIQQAYLLSQNVNEDLMNSLQIINQTVSVSNPGYKNKNNYNESKLYRTIELMEKENYFTKLEDDNKEVYHPLKDSLNMYDATCNVEMIKIQLKQKILGIHLQVLQKKQQNAQQDQQKHQELSQKLQQLKRSIQNDINLIQNTESEMKDKKSFINNSSIYNNDSLCRSSVMFYK